MEIIFSNEVSSEYLALIETIIEDEDFLSLHEYVQHYRTSRLMHSINVSYLSWLLAKKWHCDEKAAARAGLLHDFCTDELKVDSLKEQSLVFYHPKAAAINSKQKFDLHERELSAILTHMFPLGPVPRNKEAWIINLSDKLCAVMEFLGISIVLSRHEKVVIRSAI